jgi:sec-independent protein translocase protein TatA
MPNLGFGELLVILLIALMVFGPSKLPEMGRSIGKSLKEFRKASSQIRSELELDEDLDEDLDEEPPRVPSPARARAKQEDGGVEDAPLPETPSERAAD